MRLRKHAAALALAAAIAPGLALARPQRPRGSGHAPQQDANGPATRQSAPATCPRPRPTSSSAPSSSTAPTSAASSPRRSYLGVSTSTVPAALRQHLGLPEGVGLVVEFVEPDSPAQSAGLKQYDIIKKLDEQILVNAQQLAVLVRSRKAGDEVKLSLIRGGKEQTLSAKLVEKEVKELGDIFQDWARPASAV